MLLIVSGQVPVLLTVTVCAALGTFTAVLNVRLAGDTEATGATPVPLNEIVCGLEGSESLMDTEATRAPTAVGLNVMRMVQLAPAAKVAPHVVEPAKLLEFVPVRIMLVMVRAAVPVLDSVTVCAALVVFTSWFPKASAVGVTPATGTAPVPLSATFTVGFTGSLLLTVRFAARAPVAVGLNVTLMVQFAAPASVAGHALVWAKSPGFAPARPMLVMVKAAVPVLDRVTICAALVVPVS